MEHLNTEPRDLVQQIERRASVPSGTGDRFAGYAIIGLPFRSGHVLALRRFPGSSLGSGYTSVWHRAPSGRWTFYSTIAPEQSCSRYFGSDRDGDVAGPIQVEWSGPCQFRVVAEGSHPLNWEVTLADSFATRWLNRAAGLLPDAWRQKPFMLTVMGIAARFILGAGKMNLAGRTPNGQDFVASPDQVWLVKSSRAIINGVNAGPMGALREQARLNDFLIPQRGLFAIARAYLQ